LPAISHIATFNPTGARRRILEDLACPACGHCDPAVAYSRVIENKIRLFCDCCGSFITILLSEEQARVLHHWSATLPDAGDPRSQTPRTRGPAAP
jgi:hypothetical protein